MTRSDGILVGTALAAFAWLVVRAATQAITIDEATSYMLFAMHTQPFHWLASTNNHVLNTALMRLSTIVFGLSEFTVRIPALLGAAIYITACVRFCRRMGGEWWLRWLALVCLVGGPFVMDYLVAARGYGLALGFLMTMMMCDFRTVRGSAWVSVCAGLCLASNFSFALAAIAVAVVMLVRSMYEPKEARWKLVVAYLVPGLVITWLISLPAILTFPKAELWYGKQSLRESLASVVESQMRFIHPEALESAQAYLFPLLALVSIAWIAWNWRRLPALALQFGAAFVLTMALHTIAFHAFGLLYPWDRTGLFLVPLGLGAIFAAAAIPGTAWLRYVQVGVLGLLALNNFLCLRLDYFEEWFWDRDTDRIYARLACLHDRENVNHVAAGWPYIGALNFYREMAPRGRFEAVVDEQGAPASTEVFVVGRDLNPDAVKAHNLTPIWDSKESSAQIAVPPEHVDRLRASGCVSE
jgi:hypothetical protein